MNNFAELQLLSMTEFSFNTLPRKFWIASLLKCVSDFPADVSCFKKNANYNIQVYDFAQNMLSSFNVKGLEALGFCPFQLDITTKLYFCSYF